MAETIAINSETVLGSIMKANRSVLITGKNVNEDYSYGSVFNPPLMKKASITLKVEYGVH